MRSQYIHLLPAELTGSSTEAFLEKGGRNCPLWVWVKIPRQAVKQVLGQKILEQAFRKLRLGGEQQIMQYSKDGAKVCLPSGFFFDETKIRRPKEYGKYNTEVTVKNLSSVEFLI